MADGPNVAPAEGAGVHLVVLQHGLWGNPAHLRMVREHLETHIQPKRSTDSLRFVYSDVNVGYLTYDGVDVCGDRLVELVLQQGPVEKLSLIGYSLGGLMCRYAAGKLLALGYFEETEPMNFITIATPHLGSWRSPESWTNRAFNAVVPLAISRTGHQVMLKDDHWRGQPLLALMAHPRHAFHRALGRFRRLTALANIEHDRTVPYCTAALCLDNPYAKGAAEPIDETYPSVVQPAAKGTQRPNLLSYDGKSRYLVRFLLTPILMPIMVPYFVYLILCGVRHFSSSKQTRRDMAWLDSYFHERPGSAGPGPLPPVGQLHLQQQQQQEQEQHKQQPQQQQQQQHKQQERPQQQAQQQEAAGRQQHAQLQQQEEQEALLQRPGSGTSMRLRSSTKAPRNGPAPSAFAGAAAASGPTPQQQSFNSASTPPTRRLSSGLGVEDVDDEMLMGGSDDGDVPPTLPPSPRGSLDNRGSVREREGIVEAPAALHSMQEWLVEHLNKGLAWHKVDVAMRHYHSHAAIVIRDEKKFKGTSRDHLQYVADTFEL